MPMQIEINYNDVLIENQRVNRPNHMSPKVWCDYWDDVVWGVANKETVIKLEEEVESLKELNETLRTKLHKVQDELDEINAMLDERAI